MTADGSALLRYAMIISVQKLSQVINQIQQDFQEYRDTTKKRILKRPLK